MYVVYLRMKRVRSVTMADDVIHEMNAAQVLQKQLFDAHEPNLLDENGELPLLIFQLFSRVSSTKGYLYQVAHVDFLVLLAHMCFFSLIFCGHHMRLYCLLCILLGRRLHQTAERERNQSK